MRKRYVQAPDGGGERPAASLLRRAEGHDLFFVGYGLLVVIGLLTSIHCVAMCGGINLSQSTKGVARGIGDAGGERAVPVRRRLLPAVLYNGGRLVSYTAVGGAVGALGSVVSFSGHAQAAIIIAAGIFMIVMGVNMLNVFPWLRKLTPRLPKALSGKLANAVRGKGPFLVGLLNGFMPCGPLQSMQLYALATGSFIAGAASMFLFALGTVPLMFAFGAVSTLFTRRWSVRMMKISAILVLFLGAGMIVRGLNLTGVGIGPAASGPANVAHIVDGRQEVVSRVTSSSYEPIIVQAGLPVRWTLKAGAGDLNGCNGTITIPDFNITKKLTPGDNAIEFTPKSAGNVGFTCWMGMISSTIRVVSDLSKVSRDDVKKLAETAGEPALSAPPPFPENVAAAVPAVTRDGVQSLTIDVGANGYAPAVIVLKKGVKARLDFKLDKPDLDNYRMLVPHYNARSELQKGDNVVNFIPDADFFVVNWTSLYTAVILVADDPAKVAKDKNEIETRIGQLKERY